METFHLFSIHSHIMYLVAKATIRHEGLRAEDCVFVLTRDYKTPRDDDGIVRDDFPFPNWDIRFYYGEDHETVRDNIGRIDRYVEQITQGRPFHYYAQTTLSYYVNIIASHGNCLGYSFIEEGSAVYWKKNILNKRLMPLPKDVDPGLMDKCNDSRLLTFGREYFNVTHPKFRFAYAVHPEAFPCAGKEKRVVLKDVFQKEHIPSCEGADAVFIPSDERRRTGLSIHHYERTMIWFVEKILLPAGHERVVYKFRRETQASEEKVMFERIFGKYPAIEFVELPNDTVMENVIYSYDIPTYFLLTSTGGYAGQMGRRAVSIAKAYQEFDKGFHNFRGYNVFDDMEHFGVEFPVPRKNDVKEIVLDREVHSFDVFDTLVTRRTATPGGVFVLMQHKLRKSHSKEFHADLIDGFPEKRKAAESRAGSARKNDYRHRVIGLADEDVTLDDIYRALQECHGLSDAQKSFLKNLEIETERECLIGVPENIENVHSLLEQGKRVVLISDMYLPKDVLRDLLRGIDGRVASCPLYLSSEIKLKKATGNLFRHVLDMEGLKPSQLHHTGDNPHADVRVPRKMGIHAVHYTDSALRPHENALLESGGDHDILLQFSVGTSRYFRIAHPGHLPSESLGAGLGGPLFFGFLWDMLSRVGENGIDRLYFLARDGWILRKIAMTLAEKRGIAVDMRYLYASRKVVYMASYFDFSPHEFELAWFTGVSLTIEEFAGKIFMPVRTVVEALPEKYRNIRNIATRILSRKERNELASHFRDHAGFRAEVTAQAGLVRERFLDYLKQEEVPNDETVSMVDIGWHLVTARKLRCLLGTVNPEIKMNVFTFGTSAQPRLFPVWSNVFTGFPYSSHSRVFSELFHRDRGIDYTGIVEQLAVANEGATQDFIRKDDGTIRPLQGTVPPSLIRWGVNEYRDAVVWYAGCLADAVLKYDFPMENLMARMGDRLNSYLCHPSKETADVLGDIPFSVSATDSRVRTSAPVLSLWDAFRFFFARNHRDVSLHFGYSLIRSPWHVRTAGRALLALRNRIAPNYRFLRDLLARVKSRVTREIPVAKTRAKAFVKYGLNRFRHGVRSLSGNLLPGISGKSVARRKRRGTRNDETPAIPRGDRPGRDEKDAA